MGAESTIEWTDATWNPVTGCSKFSAGCAHCYAERMSRRLQAMGQRHYARGFAVTVHEDALGLPLKWKRPQMVFVNSMSDLFHEQVPLQFIRQVVNVMRLAHWHRFQVLTKRSGRLVDLADHIEWPGNVWLGVSVENRDYSERIDDLRQINAEVRFLSLEPLLGPMPNLHLQGIHWVIVGGESGPGARPMKEEWVVDVRNQCQRAGIPFFFKQWGGVNKKRTGRVLEGRVWNQIPRTTSRPMAFLT